MSDQSEWSRTKFGEPFGVAVTAFEDERFAEILFGTTLIDQTSLIFKIIFVQSRKKGFRGKVW
jgi:hypothetical protein